MVENLEIDREGLFKHRRFRKLVYKGIKLFSNITLGMYFDVQVQGNEHIPDHSCVVATHHCINFDWLFMVNVLDRKCHGWMDEDIIRRNGFLEKLLEVICVKTDKDATAEHYHRTKDLSKFWLENDDGYIVSVTDGPSKHLVDDELKPMDLADRPNYPGLVTLAKELDAVIVPYASWIPEEHANSLFASRGFKADWKYIRENKKIPYRGMIGEPIIPSEVGSRGKLRKLVRERQLEMYEKIRED